MKIMNKSGPIYRSDPATDLIEMFGIYPLSSISQRNYIA